MLNAPEYLKPAIILVFWTFGILLLIPITRFRAVIKGQAKRSDFKFGETNELPDYVKLPNRNLMNLLEMPVLFYVASIILAIDSNVSTFTSILLWGYVGARIIHSIIHIGINSIMPRLLAFAISNVLLIIIWVKIAIKYFI